MTSRKTHHEYAGSYWLTKYNKAKGRLLNTVDYHKTVFVFIHTTRASIFCKGKQVFFVDKSEITLCKEATVELSIYVKDFPKNLSEEIVKMSEKRA